MGEKKILVVDDEKNILELVEYNLTQEDYEVILAANSQEALSKIKKNSPDLIILDIMLPGQNGFEICKTLQKQPSTQQIPIILLSAKNEVEDKVRGLEMGATDYLTKPFSPRELISRVRVIFRRINLGSLQQEQDILEYGQLTIDLKGYQVLIKDQEIELTNKEFSLLIYLLNKIEEVCSREELMAEVWDYESFSSIRTVDVHIRMLRKKFNKYNLKSLEIKTVRGVGYKLIYNKEFE